MPPVAYVSSGDEDEYDTPFSGGLGTAGTPAGAPFFAEAPAPTGGTEEGFGFAPAPAPGAASPEEVVDARYSARLDKRLELLARLKRWVSRAASLSLSLSRGGWVAPSLPRLRAPPRPTVGDDDNEYC